jgi:RNA polymerase sigma factor (sigma-70 family)
VVDWRQPIMTTARAREWTEDLMADAAWTRRLATALLGDPDAAADVHQDIWIKTRGQGPREAERRRAWFRSVVGNALRSQRRTQLRRQRREQVVLAASATVPSPEDMLARLEVQKIIAGLVTALPEPGREMVLLRYYEGLTSSQIAAATGDPPGTVRWRIHNALAELRIQLEKHYGQRGQSWRMALLPLGPAAAVPASPAANPATGPASRRSPALVMGAATGVLFALLGAALYFGWPAGGPDSARGPAPAGAQTAANPAPGRSLRPGRGSGSVPVLSAAALAPACPEEVAALEAKVADARRAMAYYLPPRIAYHDAGRRNPAGTAALAPIIHRWLDEHGAPREVREVKCQGDACKIKVTEPWPPRPPWVDRPPGATVAAALERVARDIVVEGPVEEREVSPSVAETWVWLRLRGQDGQPLDAPAPVFPPWLLPSGSASAATVWAPRSEACRDATAALGSELESLRLRAEKEMFASVLYDHEPLANPALAATLQPIIDRAHDAAGTPALDRSTPLTVSCRGLVCKVEPPPGVSVKSQTMKVLMDDQELRPRVRRVSLESINDRAKGPLYFTVLRAPSESRAGGDMIRHFASQMRREVLGTCQQRAPGRGTLSVQFFCPGEGETNQDGVARRISFRLGDALADAPFGRCVAEELAIRAAAFQLPADVSRTEASQSVDVP